MVESTNQPRETEPVTRARETIGCHSPPSQFRRQHHELLVRLSTLMLPLQLGIYAWIDGHSWTRGPPRKRPSHPGRACNLPYPQYGTNGTLPVRKYSATVAFGRPDLRPHRPPNVARRFTKGWPWTVCYRSRWLCGDRPSDITLAVSFVRAHVRFHRWQSAVTRAPAAESYGAPA
jgi:hypothetical protein